MKVRFSDQHHFLRNISDNLGESVSEQIFTDAIQLLFDEKIISEREGNIILASVSDDILGDSASEIRARMLKRILQRLDRKGFH